MSDFSVNIGPRLARQAGSAAQVLSAIVPDPPQAIRSLDNGTILKGIVQGRDHDGTTVIATDKGTIKVLVNPSPAPGTPVTLEVRIAGDRLQVLILAMDNVQGPAKARADAGETALDPVTSKGPGAQGHDKTAPSLQQPPPKAGAASASTTAPAAIVTRTGMVVEAILVRGDAQALRQIAEAGKTAPVTGASQPSGTRPQSDPPAKAHTPASHPSGPPSPTKPSVLQPELRWQIEGLFQRRAGAQQDVQGHSSPPAGNQKGNQPGAIGTGGRAGFPATHQHNIGNSPAGASPAWASLPAGAEVKVRVALPIPLLPSDGAVTEAAPLGSRSISGRLIGHTPTGATIVATPFGALVVKQDLALPVGTEILLTLEQQTSSVMPALSTPGTTMSAQQLLLQTSRGWPSLMEVIALLRGRSAPGQSSDPVSRLPQPGPRLAAGMLRVMHAIEQADMIALLGPAARQQMRGAGRRDEIIARLGQELTQLSRFAGERAASDWHCYFIPFWDEGALRQINMFYRRSRQGHDKHRGQESNGSRFVVEIELSRMGAFQFDGLVREKRFDLVVRSRLALDREMRRDIGLLFQQALEIGRYSGDIAFQTVRDFPVAPLDSIARALTVVSA